MESFEVSYMPQSVPPMVNSKYFIVFVECSGTGTYLKDKIYTNYSDAISAKESSRTGILDSFIRPCDSVEEANEWLSRYKKWNNQY